MMELFRTFVVTLPPHVKLLVAIFVMFMLLGAGLYDARSTAMDNREQVQMVRDSVRSLGRDLQRLSSDTDNILCLLIQQENDDPLVCVEERRLNQLLNRR